MYSELEPIFKKYELLRAEADLLFARIAEQCPDGVRCRPGCSDCCHALFDLSLVEAMYINRAFVNAFSTGRQRSDIVERASELDRRLARLKRDMFRAEKNGEDVAAIMAEAAKMRARCPLLNDERTCMLYDARPITCRLYGVPLDIGGKGHVCGFSGFQRGENLPTVRLGKIQERLEDMSAEMAEVLKSRFDLREIYVPLSMALLTRYDDAYLGIGDAKEED